jgi:hypothetical protein
VLRDKVNHAQLYRRAPQTMAGVTANPCGAGEHDQRMTQACQGLRTYHRGWGMVCMSRGGICSADPCTNVEHHLF